MLAQISSVKSLFPFNNSFEFRTLENYLNIARLSKFLGQK